jgi:hypothetical protein
MPAPAAVVQPAPPHIAQPRAPSIAGFARPRPEIGAITFS